MEPPVNPYLHMRQQYLQSTQHTRTGDILRHLLERQEEEEEELRAAAAERDLLLSQFL